MIVLLLWRCTHFGHHPPLPNICGTIDKGCPALITRAHPPAHALLFIIMAYAMSYIQNTHKSNSPLRARDHCDRTTSHSFSSAEEPLDLLESICCMNSRKTACKSKESQRSFLYACDQKGTIHDRLSSPKKNNLAVRGESGLKVWSYRTQVLKAILNDKHTHTTGYRSSDTLVLWSLPISWSE